MPHIRLMSGKLFDLLSPEADEVIPTVAFKFWRIILLLNKIGQPMTKTINIKRQNWIHFYFCLRKNGNKIEFRAYSPFHKSLSVICRWSFQFVHFQFEWIRHRHCYACSFFGTLIYIFFIERHKFVLYETFTYFI